LTDIHTKSNNSFRGITQYVTEGKTGESENAIGRMTALRWEPTHVTKHTSRVIPLYFPLISGLDVYIIETPVDIQFCEVLGSAELGDEFGDKEERIFILDGYGIQSMVVLN